jgi:hypothetical protein
MVKASLSANNCPQQSRDGQGAPLVGKGWMFSRITHHDDQSLLLRRLLQFWLNSGLFASLNEQARHASDNL